MTEHDRTKKTLEATVSNSLQSVLCNITSLAQLGLPNKKYLMFQRGVWNQYRDHMLPEVRSAIEDEELCPTELAGHVFDMMDFCTMKAFARLALHPTKFSAFEVQFDSLLEQWQESLETLICDYFCGDGESARQQQDHNSTTERVNGEPGSSVHCKPKSEFVSFSL